MYRVYQHQAAALIFPFIYSFFFLPNFQGLNIFIAFNIKDFRCIFPRSSAK